MNTVIEKENNTLKRLILYVEYTATVAVLKNRFLPVIFIPKVALDKQNRFS